LTTANAGIPVFADSTARDAAFGGTGEKVLAEGSLRFLKTPTQRSFMTARRGNLLVFRGSSVLITANAVQSVINVFFRVVIDTSALQYLMARHSFLRFIS
jgi:hypothetical protein